MDDDLTSTLKSCKNLPESEKSETGFLKSRIEEQSNLIMILKNRADEEMRKRQRFEEIVDELQSFRSNADDVLDRELRRFNVLEKRFDTLARNHEEMIKIKDEYKSENAILRSSNEKLLKELTAAQDKSLGEKTAAVKTLQLTIGTLNNELTQTKSTLSSKEHELLDKEKKWTQEKESFERQIDSLNSGLDESLSQIGKHASIIESIQKENDSKLQALNKEKEKYMTLAVERGKIIEGKSTEIRTLTEKLNTVENQLTDALQRFERDAELVDKDTNLKLSRQKADEAERRLSSLKAEYAAYVKDTNNKIQREQELNKRLQRLLDS